MADCRITQVFDVIMLDTLVLDLGHGSVFLRLGIMLLLRFQFGSTKQQSVMKINTIVLHLKIIGTDIQTAKILYLYPGRQ